MTSPGRSWPASGSVSTSCAAPLEDRVMNDLKLEFCCFLFEPYDPSTDRQAQGDNCRAGPADRDLRDRALLVEKFETPQDRQSGRGSADDGPGTLISP